MLNLAQALAASSALALMVAAGPVNAQTPAPAAPATGGAANDDQPGSDAVSEPAESADAEEADAAGGEFSGTMERSTDEMRAVLEKLMELGAQPFHTLTVEEARTQPTPADAVAAVYEDMNGSGLEPETVGNVQDITVAGADGELEARAYWPAGYDAGGEPLPVVVYFHGGGWVVAGIDAYDASPRALANQANALVVAVHYRQGPEERFPAAHDDAVAAYSYIVENAGEWNGDGTRVAVAGESAGGNLAMNVAIAARDRRLTAPLGVLSVYPVAGNDMDNESYDENAEALPLGRADMEWFVENALTSVDDAEDTRINLLGADLGGLPPVTIITAEIDPLATEGEELAGLLEEAEADVEYRHWDGVAHEFFGMAAVIPEAQDAQDFAGERLREQLGTERTD